MTRSETESSGGEAVGERTGSRSPGVGAPPWRRSHMMWALALVGVLHVPSLFNPFVADDYVYLGQAHDLTPEGVPGLFLSATMDQSASGVWWTPEGVLPFYRPVAILTFAMEYAVWGMHAFGYHLTNVLLHVLCAYLVSRLALRLTSDNRVALAAAVIFGIHPVHSEAVLWISGRFDVLVCTCMLGGVLAYFRWCDARRPTAGDRRALPWAALVLICYVVGMGCKETGLILPAVLLAGELLDWRGAGARRWDGLRGMGLMLGALAVGYLALRFRIFGGMGELPPPYGVDLSSPSAIGQILRTMGQYILDFMLFLHVEAFYFDGFWAVHWVWLSLLVACAGAMMVWGWRRAGGARVLRTSAVWMLLFTAPSLLAMPGERNVYLASAGFSVAAGVVLLSVWDGARTRRTAARRVRRVIGGLACVCVLIAGVDQVIMWGVADTSQTVYDDLLAALPDPPQGSRIYVVNQCPLNAGGFTQGVKLHYGRDDIVACALTLAPQLQGTTRDMVYRTGASTVKLVRENGVFFASFLERFALFSRPASTMAGSARRLGLELKTPLNSLAGVTEFEMALPVPLDDGRAHLFVWDNGRLRSLLDLSRRARWPRLVRCPIGVDPDAVATRR